MEKSQKSKAYQVVLNLIKESILNEELKPGQKLPSERELATSYMVSRTTIREALRALEAEGVVEVKHGNGVFIRPQKLHNELLEFRMIIESGCAALAADRATSEDLIELGKCVEEMANAVTEESGNFADLNFHFAVTKASHNSILIDTMNSLASYIKDSVRMTRRYRFMQPDRQEETLNEHKEIFLAIASRDKELSRTLMEELFVRIRKEIALISLSNNVNDKDNSTSK